MTTVLLHEGSAAPKLEPRPALHTRRCVRCAAATTA